jgi:hypothetical protein
VERLLTRLGMSEYYGLEGFDRAPAVGRVLVSAAAISAMTGLGRERLVARGVSPLARGACVCVCVLA